MNEKHWKIVSMVVGGVILPLGGWLGNWVFEANDRLTILERMTDKGGVIENLNGEMGNLKSKVEALDDLATTVAIITIDNDDRLLDVLRLNDKKR